MKPPTSIFIPFLVIVGSGIILLCSALDYRQYYFDWTGIRPETKILVETLAKSRDIDGHRIGYAAKISKQWDKQRCFARETTTAEMEKLKYYPADNIRVLAYKSLWRRNKTDGLYKGQLFAEAIVDTTTFVDYMSGCEGQLFMLSEFLVYQVMEMDYNCVGCPPVPPIIHTSESILDQQIFDKFRILYEKQMSKKNNYYWSFLEK